MAMEHWIREGAIRGGIWGPSGTMKEVSRGRYCSLVGVVIGTDPLNASFLVKQDSDCDIQAISFSKSPRFMTASAGGRVGQRETLEPDSIGIGDRLCVQLADKEAK